MPARIRAQQHDIKLPCTLVRIPNGLTSTLGGPKAVPIAPKVSPLELVCPTPLVKVKEVNYKQPLQANASPKSAYKPPRILAIDTPQSRSDPSLQVLRCDSVIRRPEECPGNFSGQIEPLMTPCIFAFDEG